MFYRTSRTPRTPRTPRAPRTSRESRDPRDSRVPRTLRQGYISPGTIPPPGGKTQGCQGSLVNLMCPVIYQGPLESPEVNARSIRRSSLCLFIPV